MTVEYHPLTLAQPFSMRRMRFVRADEPLSCPDGHRLKDTLTWDLGGFRCSAKSPDGRTSCGKLCLLIGGLGLRASDGTRVVLLVEVTIDELRKMNHEHMTWEESARLLGLYWPRPRAA